MCFYIPTKTEIIELLVGSQFFYFLSYLVNGLRTNKIGTKLLNSTIPQTFAKREGGITELSACPRHPVCPLGHHPRVSLSHPPTAIETSAGSSLTT